MKKLADVMAYDLEGKIVDELLDIHLFLPESENILEQIYYRVRIRKIKGINGKEDITDWLVLKDDERADFSYPVNQFDNGIYQVEIFAHSLDYSLISKESIFEVIIFTNRKNVISIVGDEERDILFSDSEYFISKEKQDYLNLIVETPVGQNLKGLFLELRIIDSAKGLYHKMRASLEIDKVPSAEWYDIMFPEDEKGNQVSGNKCGIVFIPCELIGNESLRVKLHYMEFSDINMTEIMENSEMMCELSDFKEAVYIDFTEHIPGIHLTSPARRNITRQIVTVKFDATNLSKYRLWTRISDEKTMDEWIEHFEITAKYILYRPGTYRVSAKVTDTECKTLIEKSETYVIAKPCRILISHEKQFMKGDRVEVKVKTDSKEVKEIKAALKNHSEVMPEIRKVSEGEYEVSFYTDMNFPTGLHTMVIEAFLNDSSSKVETTAFIVRNQNGKHGILPEK